MITVRNTTTKTIPFGKKVDFNPGITIISDPDKMTHLRKMKKPFEMYCKTCAPGSTQPIFRVEAGSLEEPKKKGPKKKNENTSPFADNTLEEALTIVQGVLDVPSLELIINTETREEVVEKAKEILEDVKKLPKNQKG